MEINLYFGAKLHTQMSLHAVKYHTISKVRAVLVNSVHVVGERLHNKIKSLQKCSKSQGNVIVYECLSLCSAQVGAERDVSTSVCI